jgi:hypothetical protein
MDYTRTPPGTLVTRQVAITSVDVVGQMATGVANVGNLINIDTSYSVGAVSVTPTVGDQWVITKQNGQWKLDHQIPFNSPNLSTVTPTQGQHVIGSGQGPVELNAGPTSTINANSPLATNAVPTTGRPAADSVPAGTQIYDSTLLKPIWSNGTVWHDASGATV